MFGKIIFFIILFIVAKFSGIVVVEFLTHMSKVIERKIKNDVDKQIKMNYNIGIAKSYKYILKWEEI